MAIDNPPVVHLGDPAIAEDPYPTYLDWNARHLVALDPDLGVVVAGYDNVATFFRKTDRFSNQHDDAGNRRMGIGTDPVPPDVEEALNQLAPECPALFTADPPEHTVHRKLANAAFNPRRMRALEPTIAAIADAQLDGIGDRRRIDFFEDFAIPFPLSVIGGILGVDYDDMQEVKDWTRDLTEGALEVLSDDRRREVVVSSRKFQTFFLEEIRALRAEPQDNLLSDLIHAELPDGRKLQDAELLPMILQFGSAGHETTTNLLTNALVVLLRRPDLMERLRTQREDIPAFLEEVLRFDPPLHAMFRRGKVDNELAGCPIHQGELVVGLMAAANWDPERFPHPETFDMDRPNLRRHLSFGLGPHFCVGAELARLEARIAYERLLDRFPHIELDEEASDLTRYHGVSIRSYRRVVINVNGE